MSHTTDNPHCPAQDRALCSTNVVEETCFRHGGPDQGVKPVFACEWCGRKFCPVCTTGVWLQGEVGEWRYVWYHCPDCPVGLAYIALPLTESVPSAGPALPDPLEVRMVADPDLQELRPGACRVLFPTVKRRGSYEAWWDGGGRCVLQLDRECLSWVELPDAVQLERPADCSPARSSEGMVPLLVAEYLLVESPKGATGETAPLTLFLELPGGYQEYEMPEGWPGDGTSRRLRIRDRIWTPEGLMNALPGLSREPWHAA